MVRIITPIVKLMGMVILLPVIILLTILQWICALAVSISTFFFSLVGGIFIVTGVLSFAFGQEPVNMMWRMVATGAGICLLPQVGKWAAVNLTYLTLLLTRKVKLLRA